MDPLKPAPTSAASPLPQVEISTTPAPGKRGPIGLSPRNDFSRVNTGTPSVPDAGSEAQKMMAPRGAEMLPKFAGSEVSMGMAVRPTVQDMIKAAMAGAQARADVTREAARQADLLGEETKTASVTATTEVPSEDYAEKLAGALEFLADQAEKTGANLGGPYSLTENKVEPGKGPGALHVMEAPGGSPIKEHKGQAHQTVPMHPGTQKGLSSEHGSTQMENTLHHAPGGSGHQQTALVGDKHKHAAAIRKIANGDMCDAKTEKVEGAGMEEAKKGLAKAEAAHESEKRAEEDPRELSSGEGLTAVLLGGPGGYFGAKKAREHGHSALSGGVLGAGGQMLGSNLGSRVGAAGAGALGKRFGIDPTSAAALGSLAGGVAGGVGGYKLLTHPFGVEKEASGFATYLRQLQYVKLAEDAINPAQISAGAAVKPDTREAGQSGGVAPAGGQPSMVGSNEAAINYTKGQAKSEPKSDMKAYVNEPALSGSTDSALSAAFAHTGQAGTKFASVTPITKTAQARELLAKFAEAAAEKQKEKSNAMGAK